MSFREKCNSKPVTPPPPPNLPIDMLSAWCSWCVLGDKEVIRESVSKGVHVNLAYQFLSERNKCNLDEAKQLFIYEVEIWAFDLLKSRQVHRASHILRNIEFDPVTHFKKIFSETYNIDVREFLGAHLQTTNSLDAEFLNAWQLLKGIANSKVVSKQIEPTLGLSLSVYSVYKMPDEWKKAIASELFILSYNNKIEAYLEPNILWKTLLDHKFTDVILWWIDCQFSKKKNLSCPDINFPKWFTTYMRQIFETFIINQEMVKMVAQLNSDENNGAKDSILNTLAKYGVVVDEDYHLQGILQRIAVTNSLENLDDILSYSHGNVNHEKFTIDLFKNCQEQDLLSVINYFICLEKYVNCEMISSFENPTFNLMVDIKNTFKSYSRLSDNIYSIAKYITDYNFNNYFKENPILFIAMIILAKKDLYDVMLNGFTLYGTIFDTETIKQVFKEIPLVNLILRKVVHKNTEKCYMFYDALQKQLNLNVDELFLFQFEHDIEMLNFETENVINTYGYKKAINHVYFIKNNRPVAASLSFILDNILEFGYLNINRKELDQKILKVAVKNVHSLTIMVSCVAFTELIGLPSEFLRTSLSFYNFLYKRCFSLEQVLNKLLNSHHENHKALVGLIESDILKNLDLTEEPHGNKGVTSLVNLETLVKYSRNQKLELPYAFLNYFAVNSWWKSFLICIQLYNYPMKQVRSLVEHFICGNYYEHLSHCLLFDIDINIEDSKSMDPRGRYLSKLGLLREDMPNKKSIENLDNDDYLPNTSNLLSILMRVHGSKDPPRNLLSASLKYNSPVLALFGVCYEPDSAVIYWLTWLVTACDLKDECTNIENLSISGKEVTRLLGSCLKNKCYRTLLLSFEIFLPEHPLTTMMKFLVDSIYLNFDLDNALKIILDFIRQTKKLPYCNVRNKDTEWTYLRNRTWVEDTSNLLIATTLQHNLHSHHTKIEFLKLLKELNIVKCFKISPDYGKIHHLLIILSKNDFPVPVNLSQIYNKSDFNREVIKCAKRLIKSHKYNKAMEVTRAANVKADFIIIKKWQDRYSKRDVDEIFWDSCVQDFEHFGINPYSAVQFFMDFIEEQHSLAIKYKILMFARKFAKLNDSPRLVEIEKQLWSTYFELKTSLAPQIQPPVEDMPVVSYLDTFKKILRKYSHLNGSTDVFVPDRELKKMINKLLDEENLWQALNLEKMFTYSHRDLLIIKTCYQISQQVVLPENLTLEQKSFLLDHALYPKINEDIEKRIVYIKANNGYGIGDGDHSKLALDILKAYSEVLSSGKYIAQRLYKITKLAVEKLYKYKELIKCDDPIDLLRKGLPKTEKPIELIQDITFIYKMKKDQVADFICEQVIEKITSCNSKSAKMWGINLDKEFNLISQLIPESSSLLGYKLFTYANALLTIQLDSGFKFESRNISPIIEIIIKAHECFSTDCNMEGITLVLKKCNTLIGILEQLEDWNSIVKIFTEIKRYNEMSYVFALLQRHDQFEYLLRRGSSKDLRLKTAVIEYLQKICSENEKMYRMVALHFSLYSEVALLWEKEALSCIHNAVDIMKSDMLRNNMDYESAVVIEINATDETKMLLEKAINYYSHAAEYHIHGEKLDEAMNAAQQAGLLALQKSLFNKNKSAWLINLSNNQIKYLLQSDLSFHQMLIIVEAYKFNVDWQSILFEQFIVRERKEFLEDFLTSIPLTDSVVHYCAKKYISSQISSCKALDHMKLLIQKVTSVYTKHQVANELGFYDITKNLLVGNQLAYLKDNASVEKVTPK